MATQPWITASDYYIGLSDAERLALIHGRDKDAAKRAREADRALTREDKRDRTYRPSANRRLGSLR